MKQTKMKEERNSPIPEKRENDKNRNHLKEKRRMSYQLRNKKEMKKKQMKQNKMKKNETHLRL